MRLQYISILIASLIALLPDMLHAQEVIRHPQPDDALQARWEWANDSGQSQLGADYWIGYSFRKLMDENSYIGHWSDDDRDEITLEEIIYNRKSEIPAGRRTGGSDRQVEKEVGVLFRMKSGQPTALTFSNMSGHVDLDELPVVWLGIAEISESIPFLTRQYQAADRDGLKEDLLVAVAIHDDADAGVPFLVDVLNGKDSDALRGNAAFWLGQHGDRTALRELEKAARTDRSQKVQEQAVFGLGQMDLEEATDILIDLARNAENRHTGKQAIFWLGQKASDKAVKALESAVYDSKDTEVQEQAVFALSQLHRDEGVPQLINVSKTHPNPKIRKTAIFWLGQSGDPRALDALIEMVQGK